MIMLDEHAREIVGMPEEWKAYRFECLPRNSHGKTHVIEVTGAIAPLKTRGKNKGDINWRKMDKSTLRTAYITPADHSKWIDEWKRKTGKCAKCQGSGQEYWGWNAVEGAKYRPCTHCNATGKANQRGAV